MPILRSGLLVVWVSAVGIWSCGAEISGDLSESEMPTSGDKPIDETDDDIPPDAGSPDNEADAGLGNEADAGTDIKGDGSAILTWVAPTLNEDKTQLTDLAGFRVYYRLPSGVTKTTDLGNVLTHTVTGLPSGIVEFWVTALNKQRVESKPSEKKSKAIQ